MLCANTMMKKRDFDNGLQRLLILLYDNVRGAGEHNLNKCKHLACSEVRASLFVDKCKSTFQAGTFFKKEGEG